MVSVLIDYKLDRYTREIKYVFDYIFDTLGLGHRFIASPSHLRQNDILLLYGLIEPTLDELEALAKHYITIFIQSDPRLFDNNGFTPDQLRRALRDVKLFSQTPIISERKFDFPAENYSDMDIHACKINFDLAGNVFYHLAKREELCDLTRKPNGCFPETASAFYQWRDIPFMDNFLWLLDNLIKEQAKSKKQYIVQKHYWPRAQDMAIAITHSVDDLQKWDTNSIFASIPEDFALFVTLRWQLLFRSVWSKLKYIFTNFEMYWNFQEFLNLEKDYNLKSTWFIAAEQTPEIDYTLDDTDLQEEIHQIQRLGHEIGLLTTDDKLNRDDFVTRKQIMLRQIQKEQLGIRQQHYNFSDKLKDLHQKLCPAYDVSDAFLENAGFKNGMTFPYHPWISSLKSNHPSLPLVFRDDFLKVSKYRTVGLDDAKQMLKKVFQATRRSRGLFCLDFTVANYTDIPYCNKLYTYVLALFKAEKAWLTTCGEIASWWEKRSKVTIEESEYELSVFFPEAMNHFVLQIFGEYKVVAVNGPEHRIEGNCIHFSNLVPNAIAILEISRNSAPGNVNLA